MTLPGRQPQAAPASDRTAAQARARAAWADLGGRLRTVTPSAIGRAVLTTVVTVGILAFAAGTWPTLLPFLVGGLLAYAVLPVVDGLDRVMPRALAAGLTMLGAVAALVAALVIVVPPLAIALFDLSQLIPPAGELEAAIREALAGLPDEAQGIALPILIAVANTVRGGLDASSGDLDSIVPVILRAVVGVVGAVLGLLVLPAWLLTILTDKRVAQRTVDRRLAGWLRPDAWAVIRMIDRAAGTYLRGFVLVAIVVGVLTFLGLTLSPRLGGPQFQGGLALATLAGLVQLVPEVGWVLGLIPVVLLVIVDPERAVVYLATYAVARVVSGWIVGGRSRTGVRVHPAILIPGIVVLSQLGFLWLLLSAPILTFTSDLVRYVHGRLSEPPRPAGVLPGEPVPAAIAAGAMAPAPVPPVYRRRRDGPPPLTAEAPSSTTSVLPATTAAATATSAQR